MKFGDVLANMVNVIDSGLTNMESTVKKVLTKKDCLSLSTTTPASRQG
jgi:hypothetical protein